MPIVNARALIYPPLDTATFRATQWSDAAEKAKFANHFLRFTGKDFARGKFTRKFYHRLQLTFGHIAHYNLEGFFATWFTSTERKVEFLRHTLHWPCYGDPAFTFSDVKRAIQRRIRRAQVLEQYQAQLGAERLAHDRALYETLRARFGSQTHVPSTEPSRAAAHNRIQPELFETRR
jgi:hypothetical protein